MVAGATEVVKWPESTLSAEHGIVTTSTMVADEWKTLRLRVDWVIANRGHEVGGSQRGWCLKSRKSAGVLSSAITREQGNPNFLMEMETAEALARTANVDAHWLRTGEGVPDKSRAGLVHLDTHEMRKWAADMLVRLEHIDPQLAWWMMRDIDLPNPTRDEFLVAARERLREQASQLTEGKVREFTRQFKGQAKG